MEKVKFENERGLELLGNYWEAESDAGIVMSHGFTGDKTEWGYFDRVAEELNEAGYNVLAFDFSGSGESDDEPLRIDNQVQDLKSAIEYFESRDIDRVGLYGHSQGGLVSLRNYDEDIETIFLTSPVTDSMPNYRQIRLDEKQREEVEEKGYWIKEREKGPRDQIVIDEEIIEEKESINQSELLEGIECPINIVHGNKDEVVPLESSESAVEKLETGELTTIQGLDHGYNEHIDRVARNAVEWFEENMPISET